MFLNSGDYHAIDFLIWLDECYNAFNKVGDFENFRGLPRRYLESRTQALVKAGILRSLRGPNGGFCLACPLEEMTLGQVHRAIKPVLEHARDRMRDGRDPQYHSPQEDQIEIEILDVLDTMSLSVYRSKKRSAA